MRKIDRSIETDRVWSDPRKLGANAMRPAAAGTPIVSLFLAAFACYLASLRSLRVAQPASLRSTKFPSRFAWSMTIPWISSRRLPDVLVRWAWRPAEGTRPVQEASPAGRRIHPATHGHCCRSLPTAKLSEDMKWAIAMAERVKAEREQIFQEHTQITDAMNALATAAQKAHDTAALDFARTAVADLLNDIELLEPMAIVVGEFLKVKLPAGQ